MPILALLPISFNYEKPRIKDRFEANSLPSVCTKHEVKHATITVTVQFISLLAMVSSRLINRFNLG